MAEGGGEKIGGKNEDMPGSIRRMLFVPRVSARFAKAGLQQCLGRKRDLQTWPGTQLSSWVLLSLLEPRTAVTATARRSFTHRSAADARALGGQRESERYVAPLASFFADLGGLTFYPV